jgi:hypothetical protein
MGTHWWLFVMVVGVRVVVVVVVVVVVGRGFRRWGSEEVDKVSA